MAPLSMEFSKQEYWSGMPFLPAKDLPYPRIEPASPALADGFFTIAPPGKLLPLVLKVKILSPKSPPASPQALQVAFPGSYLHSAISCVTLRKLLNLSVPQISHLWALPHRTVMRIKLKQVIVQSFSGVRLFVIPWTAAHQASLSISISQHFLKLMSLSQ